MSPEAISTGGMITLTPASDMWSLGIILHSMLFGYAPHEGLPARTVLWRIRSPSVKLRCPEVKVRLPRCRLVASSCCAYLQGVNPNTRKNHVFGEDTKHRETPLSTQRSTPVVPRSEGTTVSPKEMNPIAKSTLNIVNDPNHPHARSRKDVDETLSPHDKTKIDIHVEEMVRLMRYCLIRHPRKNWDVLCFCFCVFFSIKSPFLIISKLAHENIVFSSSKMHLPELFNIGVRPIKSFNFLGQLF